MSNELRDKIRAAWPEYAKTHGRQDPDFYIPPVREGGNTAALIDLAVEKAKEQQRTALNNLVKRIGHNLHNLGEIGQFIRVDYVNEFIDDEMRKL